VYSSPNIIRARRAGLVGHVARIGVMRNAYEILNGKPERKRQLRIIGVYGGLIFKCLLNRVS
jgi:hypothetical protein